MPMLQQLRSVLMMFRQPKRLMLITGVLVIGLISIGATVNVWEYTNSSQFCGTTCHTMPPEFAAYKTSSHARVNCVECHLGRDAFTVIFGRKAGDAKHVLSLVTKQYELPIHAKNMRPARDSCEKCHWPEKFSNDSLRVIKHFDSDKNNTESSTFLVMRIGGGTAREGRGRGIHWHIENQVWYISDEELKQEIPWVRVVDQRGQVIDYVDVEANLTPEQIQKSEKKLMDCIDCHNRVSHPFRSPQESVDNAIATHLIDKNIPYIKRQAVELLNREYESMAAANKAIEGLELFYHTSYPDFYSSNRSAILQAIDVLKKIYKDSVFPSMEVSWNSHPDNLGHKEWPGCFRCHDGKHISQDGSSIRLHCNICHSVPKTVAEGQPSPSISMVQAGEPPSHLATNWMAEHRFQANTDCEDCHGEHTFATDNKTFCGNSNCHGTKWTWVGLDAAFEHPIKLVGKHSELTCNLCHAKSARLEYSCTQCHQKPHLFGSDRCQDCHTPEGFKESAQKVLSAAPPVPHSLDARQNCLACHSPGTLQPVPADHTGRPNETCMQCHQMSEATTTEVSFAKSVLPILQIRCAGCHGTTAGLKVTSYESLMAGGASGPPIKPNDPNASLLIYKQNTTHKTPPRALTPDELNILKRWIAAGALNN